MSDNQKFRPGGVHIPGITDPSPDPMITEAEPVERMTQVPLPDGTTADIPDADH